MRKYLEVARILFKAQMVYRFDVVMTGLTTIGRVLFAWILWGAVFDGRQTVGGFTFPAMLSYYIVSSFLASLEMSEGVSSEVSSRIRSGTFSKYMVIPSNPQLHFLAQTFGAAGYYALFAVLAAAFCTLVFGVHLSISTDPAHIFCGVIMTVLGLTFMISYQFFIGTLTFKFQDIGFFMHLQPTAIAFATGTIVPLALLPAAVLRILRLLPFTYVTYMPSMLFTGQANMEEGINGLIILGVWTAGMFFISQRTYNRMRVRYDGVGI